MRKKQAWILPLLLLPLYLFSAPVATTATTAAPVVGIIGVRLGGDVIMYPWSIRPNLEVFHEKCGQCHSARIALSSPSTLPSYWRKTVDRMAAMPRAGIDREEAEMIFDFLVYDGATRRRFKQRRELSELVGEKKKAEERIIECVLLEYPMCVAEY